MADTLPDIPASYTTAGKTNLKILEAGFGDGYNQRAADGLNSVQDSWSILWRARADADIKTLTDFFRDKKGYEAFEWQAPGDTTIKLWTCQDYTKTPITAGYSTLKATFKQEFDIS